MFNPVRTRVEDILNAPSQYAIPVYQRDYKWGKEEALDLIDDLRSYQPPADENLFLGNIILEPAKDKRTYVVDGQQRLTTILLLLVACRMRAKELHHEDLAQTILQKVSFIDSTTAESKGCRLIASDSVREVFEFISKGSWDGKFPPMVGKKPVKRQANRLKPIYDYFHSVVSNLDKDGLSKFLFSIYNSIVIRIDIESEIDALSVFERTNARGMELEISDLLKNYLFAKKVEGIEALWGQIVENSGGTILRMLKYFFVSKKGYVLKPQLYNKLKGYAAEVGPETLTQELVDFSQFYQTTKNPNETVVKAYFEERKFEELYAYQPRYQRVVFALQALREFSVTQFCPPAYAAIECLTRSAGKSKTADAKALIRLFEAFEKYHFINNAICERVGNEVEQLYAEYCVKFAESSDFAKTVDNLINQLLGKLASEDEFVANFRDLSYSNDDVPLLCYIFDRFNNHGLDPSQYLLIYKPDPKMLRRNHNIEHWLPQKPEPALKVKKETLEVIDNVGNLLAISYKTNSRLGNASPAKKVERLKGNLSKEIQNTEYVKDFLAKYSADAHSWDDSRIQKRAKEMAEEAYRKVWKIA
jgi:hypothetical protein